MTPMDEITRLVDAVTDADRSATIHGGTDRARRASDARSALLAAVESVVRERDEWQRAAQTAGQYREAERALPLHPEHQGVTTMIKIHPSPTADTRTCDFSKVSKKTLLQSSVQHIADVAEGMRFLAAKMEEAARHHDHDKLSGIDHFHADFRTGFKETGWWDNHRKVNRHHLTEADGVPADVNLIDVLDFIVDCTMAGMARSGSVRPLTITDDVLRRAFENTAAMLAANVTVVSPPSEGAPSEGGKESK